jgi:hypothetical protein
MFMDNVDVEAEKMPETWAEVVDLIDGLYNEICLIPVQPNADGLAASIDMQTGVMNAATPAPATPAAAAAGAPALAVSAAPAAPTYTQPAPAAQAAAPTQEPEWVIVNGAMRRNPNYRAPVVVGGYTAPVQNAYDPYTSPTLLPSTAGVVQQTNQYGQPVYVNPIAGGHVQPAVVGGYSQPVQQVQQGVNLSSMDFHNQTPTYTNGIPRI